MSDIPSSIVGNMILDQIRKKKPEVYDEAVEAVMAVEALVRVHEKTVQPKTWAFVMQCFAVQLKGMKTWPKERSAI